MNSAKDFQNGTATRCCLSPTGFRRDGMLKSIGLWGFIRIGVYCAISALLIRYGLFVKSAATGSNFYRIFLVGGAAFFGLAVCVVFKVWSRLPKFLRIGTSVIVIIGIVLFVTIEALILSHFDDSEQDVDYLIVLGAQVKESGPSLVLQYRLDKAVMYLNEHPNTKCIVSGGQGDNEPFSEAEGMFRYLVDNGIDAARITLEDQSKNTTENLKNSRILLPSKDVKVGILTNNFHIFRAMKIAKKQGLTNASPVVAESKKEFLPNNMLREFVGTMKDFLFGNM